MNRQEFDRLCEGFTELLNVWTDLSNEEILTLLETVYIERFENQPVDYTTFGDNDPGPTTEYGAAELQTGIFNVVMHLVRTRSQTSTPYAARAQVAAWLEEIAAGLKQFTTPEE